jgi:hypothetical protein
MRVVTMIDLYIALKRLRASPLDLLDIQTLEALGKPGAEAPPGSEDA